MSGNPKSISARAIYAGEVLSVFQATKRHLADLLKIDVSKVDQILEELRSMGMPLRSSIAEDNRIYYWMEKTDGI